MTLVCPSAVGPYANWFDSGQGVRQTPAVQRAEPHVDLLAEV